MSYKTKLLERIEAILQKLIVKKGINVHSFEVKEIVGEYGFVMKQCLQIKNEKDLMLAQIQYFYNENMEMVLLIFLYK